MGDQAQTKAMMILRSGASAALLFLALGAQAQYKCVDASGATVFQQTPCPVGAKQSAVGPKPAAPPASAPTRWVDPSRPEKIRKAVQEGYVEVGMTFEEVYRIAGRPPDRSNTTTTARGTRVQQIYEMPNRTVYVYLEQDVVTSVQIVRR